MVGHIESALISTAMDLAFQKLQPDIDCSRFNTEATVVLGLLRKNPESFLLAFTELLKNNRHDGGL